MVMVSPRNVGQHGTPSIHGLFLACQSPFKLLKIRWRYLSPASLLAGFLPSTVSTMKVDEFSVVTIFS